MYHMVKLICVVAAFPVELAADFAGELEPRASLAESLENYTFANYKADFARNYFDGSAEHDLRELLFKKRLKEIIVHNAEKRSWLMGVNQFTDLTDEELRQRRGYISKRRLSPSLFAEVSRSVGSSLLNTTSYAQIRTGKVLDDVSGDVAGDGKNCLSRQSACAVSGSSSCCSGLVCSDDGSCVQPNEAESFDWTSRLHTASEVHDQGACGSCWAVAATAAIQFAAETASKGLFQGILSPQSILSCTPNKLECGGQGGCKGATAELAFQWVMSRGEAGGVWLMKHMAYNAKDTDGCPTTEGTPAFLQKKATSPGVIVKGWEKVKENNAELLARALTTNGPVVASIVGEDLNGYHSGVLDHCKTAVVDHAVVMMGYGKVKATDTNYWRIRNSWGKGWGEKGFFRLKRYWPHKEEPCFLDSDPSKGVACKDQEGPDGKYPERQEACGTCGILMDSSYATGVSVPKSLLSPLAKQTEAVSAGDFREGAARSGILSRLPSFNSIAGLHLAEGWSTFH